MSEQQLGGQSAPKPVRFRTACDHCNASKVKCTGERQSPCSRCINLGVQCVYSPSKVGKVAGSRSKRRRAAEPFSQSGADPIPHPYGTTINHPPPTPVSQPIAGTDASLSNWEPGLDDLLDDDYSGFNPNAFDDLMGQEPISRTIGGISSSMTSGHLAFTPTIADIRPGSRQEHPQPQQQQQRQQQSNSAASAHEAQPLQDTLQPSMSAPGATNIAKSELDSECVAECTDIIGRLENYVASGLSELDLILDITKAATLEIHEMAKLQESSPSCRPVMLLTVAKDQIVVLLESGCAGLLRDTSSRADPDTRPKLRRSLMFGTGKGAMRMDAEEQLALKAQHVLKHLRKNADMLRVVTELAAVRFGIMSLEGAEDSQDSSCNASPERRLRLLIERMEQCKQNASAAVL